MSTYEDIDPSELGPSMWLIDEMYRRYRDDPEAVNPAWQEFFEDFRPALEAGEPSPGVESPAVADEPAVASKERTPPPGARAKTTIPEGAERLRFARERIVKNMEASLDLPTATSFRIVPAKLLEENRRVANRYLSRSRRGKVSFTHLI